MKNAMGSKIKRIAISSIFLALSFLPITVLRSLSSIIGLTMLKVSKKAALRLRHNLLITNMCTDEAVDKMANKTAMELSKTLIETACIAWQRSKEHNAKFILKTTNFNLVEDAAKNNRPIMFLTPHIGNFEIALKYTATQIKRRFTVLYKPDKTEWWNQLMLNGRREDNILPVPTNRQGVVTLVKSLREGGIIGVLPDSVASQGDGLWVDFFHNKVFATTLAAKLALMPDVATFIVASYRRSGGFDVNYVPFIPATSDITTVVQDIYKVIENMVLKAPTQFYWSYDRFRTPQHAKSNL